MKPPSRLRRLLTRSPKPPQSGPTTSTTDRNEPPQSASVNAKAADQVSLSPTRQSSTPSLWQKAYEQLDPDLVERFNELLHQEAPSSNSIETDPNNPTRDDVDRICQDGRRRMEQAETTFRLNSKEHKAHDAFVKGLAVITWAKDLVSTAIDKASSPEASLAWAAAILVLPLFENIDTVREANKTGFTYVTACMKFYAALETSFRSLGPPASQDLVDATEESIVDLYRNILTFQLQSGIRFNRNKFKNKLRDMVDYDGWKTLLQGVKDAESLVNQRWESLQRTVGLDSLRGLREEATSSFQLLQKHLEELRNISQNTDEMVVMMKKSEARAMSEAEQKHLQSLRHHTTTQDQSYELAKDRTEKRVDGTCKWLHADEQYQAWLRTGSGLLVISADPGCGKSVISRYLIEEGLPRDGLTICYFFFKDEDQDRVHLALCALLHQLLASKPFLITKYLATEYSKNGASLKTNVSVLWKVLKSALKDSRTGRVVIIVDGLDECKSEELGDFCDTVNSLFSVTELNQQTGFIVTTRPYDQITSRFNARHIRVAGELKSGTIREEVKLVIQDRIKNLRKMPNIIPNALLPHLEEKLLSVDHPTYLWAALTFKFIESGKFKKTDRGLHEAIDRLPRTINEAYEKILRKADPEDEAMVRRMLTIVLGARRPLSVDEMNVALNLTPDKKSLDELDLEDKSDFATHLRNSTGLFITIFENRVYFLHQTVREFLVGDSSSSAHDNTERGHWHGTFSLCDANKMLAGIFLHYIPLYLKCFKSELLTASWLSETIDKPTARLYLLATDFIKVYLTEDIDNDLLDLSVHVLTYFGRDLSEPLENPPEDGTDHELAILLAAYNCVPSIVKYLSSLPNVSLECCDERSRTPLVLAFEIDWVVMESSSKYLKMPIGSLHTRRLATVSALLEAGANPNPKLGKGVEAPIVAATYWENLSLVTKLIAHGAAVDNDSLQMHGMSSETGIKPFRRLGKSSENTLTALHFAVTNCDYEIVETLLKAGADIEARTQDGSTPLHLAVETGSKSKASLLIAHEADVHSQNNEGETPLSFAGFEQMAFMLISAGADINTSLRDQETLLHYAARGNWGDAVEMFCAQGADIKAKNCYGSTPLHEAVYCENLDMTRLIVSLGADIDARDDQGLTPLHYAVDDDSEELVAFLLSSGAQANVTDDEGWTPLMSAENSSVEVKELLLGSISEGGMADT